MSESRACAAWTRWLVDEEFTERPGTRHRGYLAAVRARSYTLGDGSSLMRRRYVFAEKPRQVAAPRDHLLVSPFEDVAPSWRGDGEA